MRFNHPMEAQQLHGLGPKLCQRLTDKLEEYCRQNGKAMPEMPYQGECEHAKEEWPVLKTGQAQGDNPMMTTQKAGHPRRDGAGRNLSHIRRPIALAHGLS